jgi:cyclic pyranopterin phosphate synthase
VGDLTEKPCIKLGYLRYNFDKYEINYFAGRLAQLIDQPGQPNLNPAGSFFLEVTRMALDRYGRSIHYLRISLTDHCNLRCVYCMPEDMTFRPNAELMQDDEIVQLVRLFADLGFDKIRLTGGEPTVRAHVADLVAAIAHTPGIHSLSMTTNGILLSRLAQSLAQAGLQRVNISLDTLDPAKFRRLTRWGSLDDVWAGIQAAEAVGLTPIKLNAVVVRGYNEKDVSELARLTLDHPWQVRFIEMMPFAGATELQLTQAVSAQEIQERIAAEVGPLQVTNGGKLDGEARLFRLPHSQGDVGFISTVTQPFCASCSRARLTADGRLRLCLLREGEVDLLSPLRAGATLEDLRQIILKGIWYKPWGHALSEGVIPLNRVMSEIGG